MKSQNSKVRKLRRQKRARNSMVSIQERVSICFTVSGNGKYQKMSLGFVCSLYGSRVIWNKSPWKSWGGQLCAHPHWHCCFCTTWRHSEGESIPWCHSVPSKWNNQGNTILSQLYACLVTSQSSTRLTDTSALGMLQGLSMTLTMVQKRV